MTKGKLQSKYINHLAYNTTFLFFFGFRYLVLDHLSYDRTQIIMTYVEDLNKRGPPPPPTASESTRRK